MDTKTINLRDLPEDLVRRAKACAALHGMTLKEFVIKALESATQRDIPVVTGAFGFMGARRKRRITKRLEQV